jgi:acetyltransferase-like isoleucine patch superfamily enzyme
MSFFFRIWSKLLQIWWQLTVPMRLRAQGVELGAGGRFYGMPIVRKYPGSRIVLGDRIVLCSDSRFTALGVNHPVILGTLRERAEIIIGRDCGISGGSICAAIRVELGDECLLGANVTVVDCDFHALKPEGRRFNGNQDEIATSPVYIESNVFVGTGSLVLKGVRIGKNGVVGAGSVVTKSLPSDVISAGNPSKIIKDLQ